MHGSDDDVLTLLAGSTLFEGVAAGELTAIAAELDEQHHPAGDHVVTEGTGGADFFIVVDGAADIEVGGVRVASLGRGDFFGEVGALDQGPRTATVRATTPLRSLGLPNGRLHGFLVDHPRVAVNMLYVSVRRFRVAMTSGRRTAGSGAQ
jgi:CRP-like cAMP-binding protein